MVGTRQSVQRERGAWIPDRQDIIWIDCNSQIWQEMREVHPFLMLSPRIFNVKTSLVMGLPMTTAEYNADNPFAVTVGKVKGRKTGQTSYVLCHQPKSFDWWLRSGKPHPLGTLSDGLFAQVCERLNQIIRRV